MREATPSPPTTRATVEQEGSRQVTEHVTFGLLEVVKPRNPALGDSENVSKGYIVLHCVSVVDT